MVPDKTETHAETIPAVFFRRELHQRTISRKYRSHQTIHVSLQIKALKIITQSALTKRTMCEDAMSSMVERDPVAKKKNKAKKVAAKYKKAPGAPR